ncbi:MAG: serpin family protein [Polyangiaceae bacterium]
MKTRILLTLLVGFAAGAWGCTDNPEACHDPNTPGCEIISAKERITNPEVSHAEQTTLTNGNTAFALDVYREARKNDGNLFYSPFSISQALAMTWAGAKGQTETDMAATLHFDLEQDKLHPAFDWLDLELKSRGQGAQGTDGDPFKLHVVNALWGQVGLSFLTPFVDTLGQFYGVGVHVADFSNDPKGSVDLINAWADDATEGMVEKLLPESAVTANTVLVLTNAVYFNAAWATPFDGANTETKSFKRVDGSTVDVPMMHGSQEAPYADGPGYQAVSIPYDGGELSMLLVLPNEGELDSFEASLDVEKLASIADSATTHMVDVQMPRFEIDGWLSVKEILESLGMGVAFDSTRADFSGTLDSPLYVQDMLHRAVVTVNEEGTKAAAASAVLEGAESSPEPASIALDHPFLLFIRDNATGTVLFAGRVVDPS